MDHSSTEETEGVSLARISLNTLEQSRTNKQVIPKRLCGKAQNYTKKNEEQNHLEKHLKIDQNL